jgi:sulfur-carrier protein
MKVFLPSPLHSYTGRRSPVEAKGATLTELLGDLDRQYPGIRFRVVDEQDRIRPHMVIFVSGKKARDLRESVSETDEITLVAALSGG